VIPDSLILLAGFVLAHSAWSVSDLSKGEFLVPLAIVEKTGQRQLLRFEAQTQEQAIAEGKAALAQRQGQLDAWAFGREGLLSGGTGKEGAEAARLVKKLYEGALQHPKAGKLWQGRRAK